MVEVDPRLPMIEIPEAIGFDLRRQAKGACLNERWLRGIGTRGYFSRTDLDRRSVQKVTDAFTPTGREFHRDYRDVPQMKCRSTAQIERALLRIERAAR